MSKAKKHHIVPECLLKKFANVEGRLTRLKFKETYETAGKLFYPAQIGYREDFYRIQDEFTGFDSLLVEDFVNTSYENDLNRCWANFENDISTVSLTWKRRMSEIMIHLMSRSEFVRNGVFTGDGRKGLIDSFKKNWMEDLKQGSLNPMALELYATFLQRPDELEKFANEVFPSDKAQFLHSMFLLDHEKSPRTSNKEKVVNMFINGFWTIHKAVSGQEFILSDRVGMFYNTSSSKLPLTGAFNFYFPISSSKYLQIDYYGQDQPYGVQRKLYFAKAEQQHVLSMNTTVMANALSEVYGTHGQLLEETRQHYQSEM